MTEPVLFEVKGMHCPDCPTKIEKLVSTLTGVIAVHINYSTEDGRVTFNKSLVQMSDIAHVINKMGFEISKSTVQKKRK